MSAADKPALTVSRPETSAVQNPRYLEHHSNDWIRALDEGWYTEHVFMLVNGVRIAEMVRNN